jgi:hypothetical protein
LVERELPKLEVAGSRPVVRFLVRHLRYLIAAVAACLGFVLVASAPAFADAFGPQLQITHQGPAGNTTYLAAMPALAYNPRANEYLAVYVGSTTATTSDIYGQRLDSTGAPAGSPFLISTTAQGHNEFNPPGIAYNPDLDQYLVAWSRQDDESVHYRRVSAGGVPIAPGDTTVVTNQADVESTQPAYSPQSGQYLLVWKGNDDSVGRVRGQRITGDGGMVGPTAFDLGGSDTLPADDAVGIVYNASSREFFVVFRAQLGGNNHEYEIVGQRVGLDGSQIGPDDFRISDMGPDGSTSFSAQPPRVAWDSHNNQYLVVWTGDDDTPPLVNKELEVFGQLLRADGSQTGNNDFRISDMGPNGNKNFGAFGSRVEFDPNADRFLVTWHGDDNTPPLVDNKYEVYGQDVSTDGTQVGTNDFRISVTQPEGDELADAYRPDIAYNPRSCDFLVAWFRGGDDISGGGGDSSGESEVFDRRVAEPPCVAAAAPARDTRPPVISGMRVSPNTIAGAAAAVAESRRLARRTRVRYRLSEPAFVRFTVQRRTIGRRVGRRCRRATRRNRSRRRCARYVKVGRSFTQVGKRGKNSKSFSRRTIRRRRLRSGRYRLAAVAFDPAGNRSRTRYARFKVKRPRR